MFLTFCSNRISKGVGFKGGRVCACYFVWTIYIEQRIEGEVKMKDKKRKNEDGMLIDDKLILDLTLDPKVRDRRIQDEMCKVDRLNGRNIEKND